MILKGWISALGLLVMAAIWTGCVTDQLPGPVDCTDDEIRIGDSLSITLLDVPPEQAAVEKQFVVRSDGTVNLPLLGPMQAAGRKFGDFEKELQTNYISRGFFRRVTVVVKPDLRFYSVAGEVKAPGRQQYVGQITVLRAIATCGDFTEFANRRRVEITRANGKREVMDCKKAIRDPKFDRPLCPGDHINVPKSL
jgi:protein involved in polysaccharide export with SLBB domain